MKPHGIGWLNVPGYRPETWNPIVGCSKISEGCRNCYAERMAKRLVAMGVPGYSDVWDVSDGSGGWNGKTVIHEPAVLKPFQWSKPRAVFLGSMTDVFHEATPDEWISTLFAVMDQNPQQMFIVLTKRAERMMRFCQSYYSLPSKNVWLGVTLENDDHIDRVDHLLNTPAAVRFVSCEPMLGAVVLPDGLDWIICGGESGPGARPMNPEWARSLRDQAQAGGVPFFFKQWGDNIAPAAYDSVPLQNASMQGKRGGDFLDGRQWHQWPLGGGR